MEMDRLPEFPRLMFVGDVALGNHPKTPGFGFHARYGGGIPELLAGRVLPETSGDGVLVGNLEFSLTANPALAGSQECCIGSVSYVDFLRRAGFNVLNLANNHAWQHGKEVFEETVQALRRAGIKVVGVPDDHDPGSFLRVSGKTIAILGVSARPRQGFTESPGYNEFEEREFLGRISDARRQADFVCVSIHWGQEFTAAPSAAERGIARAMVDAGADVVVGHHPHVLREVENYRGSVIAYSLGNFIGDMSWNPLTRRTGCLVVRAREPGDVVHEFMPAFVEDDCFPRYLQALRDAQLYRCPGANIR